MPRRRRSARCAHTAGRERLSDRLGVPEGRGMILLRRLLRELLRQYVRGLGWGTGFGCGALAAAWAARRLIAAGFLQ